MRNVIKKSAIAAGVLLGTVGVAQAATIDPGPGQYTFSGPATLSAPFADLTCTLSLTGDVQKDGNGGVIVTVSDGAATGGFLGICSAVGFEFPWVANVPASQIPADPTQPIGAMFENVRVSVLGSDCSANSEGATVPAMFSNGDPISEASSFSFNTPVGDCSVMGTIDAQTDVNVTQ